MPDQWENANGCDPYDAADASGDRDGDGMTGPEQTAYYQAIGVFERQDFDPTFSEIKDQIMGQRDPIAGRFKDYYNSGSTEGHAVAIVGFYDAGPLGKYCIVQDTNVTVVTYPMSWDYLQDHRKAYFIYTDGSGMAGP